MDAEDRSVQQPSGMRTGPQPAALGDEEGIPADRSPNSRRLPAGQVLVVMLVALVLGALLNADRMLERAEAKPFEEGLRDQKVWIWERVRDLSHWTGLNRPRIWLERATGRANDSEPSPIGGSAPVPSGTEGGIPTSAPGAEAMTTTTIDPTPVLRTPRAEEPLRMWVGGDSMTQTFGTSMQRIAASTGIITTTLEYRVSTGLSRPDFFDWGAHFANEILPTDPEVIVVMFGANDSQGIQLADGTICKRFEQCWLDEYRTRTAQMMDLLRDSENNDRVVIWVGQPIMGPESGVYGMEKLNFIYWDEARKRPWVEFFDSWPFFTDSEGEYAHSLPSADGTESVLRQQDQVHFSTEGGDRLSWAVLDQLSDFVDLSASQADPPRSIAPPESVRERSELPPAKPEIID